MTGGREKLPRRVLVLVGARGIGDAAEALPVFELVRRHWPHVELAAGVFKDPQVAILSRSPHVSEVVRLHGHIHDSRKSLREVRRNAAAMRGFDEVLVLARHERVGWPVALAARLAGVRLLHRHGYRYRDRRRSPFADFPAHVFFQLVASALLLERPLAELVRPRLEPAAEDRRYAEDFFARHRLTGRRVVLMNTRGPQYADMARWGIRRYVATANRLVAAGVTVVINGGTPAQVTEFTDVSGGAAPEVLLLRLPTPGQLAAVAERCHLVIGEPSGPLCVAMAVGAPTLSLQGPGEHDYPGHNRSGPVWWPHAPQDASVSRVAWCEVSMGSACLCARPSSSRPVKRLLKSVDLWRPYKRLLRRLGLYHRLHRPSRPGERVYPCLEGLTLDEVVAAALAQLDATARPVTAR